MSAAHKSGWLRQDTCALVGTWHTMADQGGIRRADGAFRRTGKGCIHALIGTICPVWTRSTVVHGQVAEGSSWTQGAITIGPRGTGRPLHIETLIENNCGIDAYTTISIGHCEFNIGTCGVEQRINRNVGLPLTTVLFIELFERLTMCRPVMTLSGTTHPFFRHPCTLSGPARFTCAHLVPLSTHR